MSEPTPFDAVVGRILQGTAPSQLRSAAARGALPLPRTTLVRLWIALERDADPEIGAAAKGSIAGLESETVLEVLSDPACAPEVLEHFADTALRDEGRAEKIAFHPAVPAGALARLASRGNAAVIDLVLTNQERLLQQPELLDQLTRNPALRADQRGRLLELLDRTMRSAERQAAAGDETDQHELELAARLLDVDPGELFAASEIMGAEELEQSTDEALRSAYRRILSLNTAQKALLAMKGGREERMVLVRDSNKLVALSVLRNPRLNEEDVEAIARMRSVSDEVLRDIGRNREWSGSYAVIQALINNPRAPQGVTLNFVPRLQNQHLKRVASNHDIPELIRRTAKRTLETRTQRPGSRLHKKR